MMEIERPKIETASLSPDGRYGRFVAEPLERGFGITLGNSLRRVLLSSLPGVAVTSVKIDGVVHEFSTIEGVKEDVTEIVLNLKGIAAKLYTDGPKTVRVEAVGPCEVTADNIKQGDDIEILNPEWHIATLGEGGKLVMELTFDKGRGYVPAERNKQAIVAQDSFDTHAYLNDLRYGNETKESEQFQRRLDRYRERYLFPDSDTAPAAAKEEPNK